MILFSQTSIALYSHCILLLRQIATEYFRDTCRFSSGDGPTAPKGKAALGNEKSWKRNLGISGKLFRSVIGVTQIPSSLIFQSGSRILTKCWVFFLHVTTVSKWWRRCGSCLWRHSGWRDSCPSESRQEAFPGDDTGLSLLSSDTSFFSLLVSPIWLCSKVGLIFLFSRYQIRLNLADSLVSWKQQVLLKIVMLG